MLSRRPFHLLLLLLVSACAPRRPEPEATPSSTSAAAGPDAARPITFAQLAALPAPPADERIAYGPRPLQFGELRLPAGTGSVPVVVLIHGGCWLSAYDISHAAPAAAALAQSGYAVWSLEYDRVGDPAGGWPTTFADIATGVDQLRALAATHPRLDTTRFVLVGHSAGGQLALWAASRHRGDMLDGTPVAAAPLRVRGVVSLAGITDLRAYGAARGSCNAAVTPLMGGTPAQVPDRYAAVDPIERAPLGVPLQFVHGAVDPVVPVAQSRTMLARARAAGASAELSLVPGMGHFDLMAPVSAAWPAVLGAIATLVR